VAYTITGLDSNGGNTFQWNGTPSSPLLADYAGIYFNTSSQPVSISYSSGTGYGSINSLVSNFNGADDSIASSTLSPAATPVPWETDALPLVSATILCGLGFWAKNKFAKPLQK
jgi:hypothetical protein